MHIQPLVAVAALLVGAVAGDMPVMIPEASADSYRAAGTRPHPQRADLWEEWRLPQHMRPVSYTVRLLPFIEEGNFLTLGAVEIYVDCLQDAGNVTLHSAVNLNESSVAVQRVDTDELLPLAGISENKEYQTVTIFANVIQGARYKISMTFDYILSSTVYKGFYLSAYMENGVKKWLGVTQLGQVYSRRAFPCFDEPQMKATYNIILGRKTSWKAVANTPLLVTVPIESQPGYVWDVFQTTVVMSTYHVAFIVSEMDHFVTDEAPNGVTYGVWARPQAANQTAYALEVGPKMSHFFEEFYEMAYPMPKQDMAAVLDFTPGAMENWGLIIYRESLLLFDAGTGTLSSQQSIADVIAHELSHMWNGNLVTCKWWNEIWLNEGFARLMQNYATEAVQPQFQVMETFSVRTLHPIFLYDSVPTHPMDNPPTFESVENKGILSSIPYNKGGCVIRMMAAFLGAETFRKGMALYMSRMAYQSATQSDLFTALNDRALIDGVSLPESLETIMDTWTSQMSFPLVSVTRNYVNGLAFVAQNSFLQFTTDPADESKWWIPLTYRGRSSSTPAAVWISEGFTPNVDLGVPPDEWLLVNVDQMGYYRVVYDPPNYALLRDQLVADHEVISSKNRVQLLDDAFNVALYGRINYTSALDLTLYLSKEQSYSPWHGILPELDYIHFMLINRGAFSDWQSYMYDLVTPYYDHVGFFEFVGDEYLTVLGRSNAVQWACRLGNGDCYNNAKAQFAAWKISPANVEVISRHQKTIILCAGIEYGSEDDWDYAFNRFLNPQDPNERSAVLSSLACAKTPAIYNRIFDVILNRPEGVSTSDGVAMFNGLANNPAANRRAFEFLRDQWAALTESYSGSMSGFFRTVSARYNTQEQLDELLELVDQHGDILGGSSTATQALTTVQTNINWINQNYLTIAEWLSANRQTRQ